MPHASLVEEHIHNSAQGGSKILNTEENLDDIYRKIEYSLPCFNNNNKNSQHIIAKYWPSVSKSRFTLLKEGMRIAMRGHLDNEEKFGTILVVESYEVI